MPRNARPVVTPTIYWRGKVAMINWHEDGKRHRRSLGEVSAERAEAVRAAKERELIERAEAHEIERRFGVKIISTAPTLRQFVEQDYLPALEAGAGRGGTAKYSLARVVERLGHIPLDKLTPIEVERFKTQRLQEAKSATVNKEIRLLRAAIRRALMLQVIERNPIEFIKPPRVLQAKSISYYTREQLELIYANADEYAAVWKFAANTGLRRAELAKARRSDVRTIGDRKVLVVESIESERGEARIDQRQTTKSRKSRTIPLNAAAIASLDHLGEDKLVPLGIKGLDKAWERVRKRTGLPGGMHTLRHTFAAHLVISGVSLRTVQQLMGHATITVTEIYAHLAPGQTTEAVNQIFLYVTDVTGWLSPHLSQQEVYFAKSLKSKTGEVPERPKGLPC